MRYLALFALLLPGLLLPGAAFGGAAPPEEGSCTCLRHASPTHGCFEAGSESCADRGSEARDPARCCRKAHEGERTVQKAACCCQPIPPGTPERHPEPRPLPAGSPEFAAACTATRTEAPQQGAEGAEIVHGRPERPASSVPRTIRYCVFLI